MISKDFFQKYFKLHNKITLYTADNIPLTISKAYHLHLDGGHCTMDIADCEDLAEFCELRGLSLEPTEVM